MPPPPLPARTQVAIVGGGQAGLSLSRLLTERGTDHVVLERAGYAHEWRDARWDSFCLVTPNWQCQLPGFPYAGDDPDGFMVKDEIVDYLEAFRASFDPLLHEGVEVTRLEHAEDGFAVQTTAGDLIAAAVVVATGGYHHPIVPRIADRLPDEVVQLHSSQYRNPGQLPPGEVLVVGTGQSGVQIAEDLHLAGRRVHLAVGSAPRCARTYRGRDVIAWLQDMGQYDIGIDEHPLGEAARHRTNHYMSGRAPHHDIDLRLFAREGMRLYGRLRDEPAGPLGTAQLSFEPSLRHDLDAADDVYRGINAAIDRHIAAERIDAPPPSVYQPVWQPDRETTALDLAAAGVTSVVWAIGYRADYSWVRVGAFDGTGYPPHHRGVTDVAGLYFLGLPWLHSWGSGRFAAIARDAAHLADRIGGHLAGPAAGHAGAPLPPALQPVG